MSVILRDQDGTIKLYCKGAVRTFYILKISADFEYIFF